MQFISARPLIEKFRTDTFAESEVGPYFMAYMIFMAVGWALVSGEPSPWDVPAGIVSVVITIAGVLYLKKQNGNSFGDHFVSKYFCLGWVVTIRMVLLGIPVGVAFYLLSTALGGDDAIVPAGALFGILFEIVFYWWLGSLFAGSMRESGVEMGVASVTT